MGPYVPSPAWSSVDVAAGSVEKGSKLPPGLLGPQCSACRVNKLKEVPYEARDLAHLASSCHILADALMKSIGITMDHPIFH